MITTRPSRSAIVLVLLTNLVPVLGVLWAGWDAGPILLLYWIESLVLGLYSIPKIIATGRGTAKAYAVGLFFSLHYGLFCLIHLLFVLKLAGPQAATYAEAWQALTAGRGFGLSVISVAVLAALGQWLNWWRPQLRRTSTVPREMRAPYSRVVILHLTVLLSAVLILHFDTPAITILVLCAIKTLIELVQTRLPVPRPRPKRKAVRAA